jgi:hypothetical protein
MLRLDVNLQTGVIEFQLFHDDEWTRQRSFRKCLLGKVFSHDDDDDFDDRGSFWCESGKTTVTSAPLPLSRILKAIRFLEF